MSAPTYLIRQTPGGSSRDTFATYRMRQALRIIPRKTAGEVWASLPLATRQRLCTDALGHAGLELYALAWGDIPARERMRIGSEARRVAVALQ